MQRHAGVVKWTITTAFEVVVPGSSPGTCAIPSRCGETDITRLCEGRAPGSTPGSEAHADDARLVEHRHGKAEHSRFDFGPRLFCLCSSMDEQRGPNATVVGSTPTGDATEEWQSGDCSGLLSRSASRHPGFESLFLRPGSPASGLATCFESRSTS
jgi:hypothetical protein